MTDDELSARYRAAWSVTLGPGDEGGPPPERVLVVPPAYTLAEGLRAFRRELERPGPEIIVVALGATVRHNWPEWLTNIKRRVRLVELDAYLPRRKGPILAQLLRPVEAWIDHVLADVAAGIEPSKVLWSAAVQRLFHPTLESWLFAVGIHRAHPHLAITCSDPSWIGVRIVRALRGERAGAPGTLRKRAAFALLYPVVAAATVAKRVGEFRREAPSRKRLASLRRVTAAATPSLWIAVSGSWARMSRPVIDILPPLARARGEKLGVLLYGSLEPGMRVDNHHDAGGAVLPTLDRDELAGTVATVDQAISVERWRDLAAVIAGSTPRSLMSAWRAFTTSARLGSAPSFELALPPVQLAKLVTLDVVRVREAQHATEALCARHRFDGRTRVVYPHVTNAIDATGNRLLMRRGVTSYELVHGLVEIQNEIGFSRTFTSQKVYWTRAEAAQIAPYRREQVCVGGFLPRPRPSAPRPMRNGRRISILVCSNYLISGFGYNSRTFEHYMEPFLGEIMQATQARDVSFRLRPHPSDDPRLVADVLARYPSLERSPSESLHDDLLWGDLLVTSLSSVALEALLFDVPVFVHQVPRWDEHTWDMFAAERRFGAVTPFAQLLPHCIEQLERGDPHLLAPEVAARRALFGPDGEPRCVDELMWPDAVAGRSRPALTRGAAS